MTTTQNTTKKIAQPIMSGVFAVLMVVASGLAVGYAFGFDAPAKAYAQFAPVPVVTPVTVTPIVEVPVTVTPPVPVPVIVPIVPPTAVTTPATAGTGTTVDSVTVTASNGSDTLSGSAGLDSITNVSSVTVTPAQNDQDTHAPHCCTESATGATVSAVTVTPAPAQDTDSHTGPCCTTQVTTQPPTIIPNTPIVPIVPVIPICTHDCTTTPPICTHDCTTTPPICTHDCTPTPPCTTNCGGGGGCVTDCGGGGGGGGCVFNCGGGGGGGGGGSGPHVLLASSQPLASVYLSQIPYTGLDLGPVGTVIYWLTLILWSLAAAYLVLFTGVPFMLRRAKSFGGSVQSALNPEPSVAEAPAPTYAVPAPPAPAYVPAPAAPMAHIAPVQMSVAAPLAPSQSQLSRDGFKSFATGEALTIDDIVKGLSRESGMVFSQHLEEEPVVAAHMDSHAAVVEAAVAEEEPAYVAPAPMAAAQPAPAAAPITYSDDISGFLSVLLAGDREAVFGTLRAVNRAGADTQEFLAHAVCALDDAYRARIDGTPVHPEIARITSSCATSFLERLVSSLATAIDSSYSAGITGAKLAVTRALAIVG